MANLQSVLDSIKAQIEFKDKAVELVVEQAFMAGGQAMAAILTIDNTNDGEPAQDLDSYVGGIAGITNSVGTFLDSLTPVQVDEYRANLKKVIVNSNPDIEAALENYADANLDLTASVIRLNKRIDELTAPQEGV